ncbi:AAA domain-containing protein [Acinetobacter sp. BIGb0102]|uniref:AAA family ATPase n=1 Tax=Acinetobacter sp. BIGb0102 TaxID=2485131 RepID=UPI000F4FC5BC|nr:AAA family ATPase [Acinetobacter sp. BIGb0102]RPE31449.1 AAA domain-containing protein [Acinetobacter sp. BIGb0102]
MSDICFPILGTNIPPAIGRHKVLGKMKASLTKLLPDHLQVTGARFSGKTVVLHELVNILSQDKNTYISVLIWDLGHKTPATDEQFLSAFAKKLASGLAENYPEYAELLQTSKDDLYADITDVLEMLKEEKKRVLMIMDGFDKPLENGKLTRNLWDQLRELAQLSSLRLVTASRRRLRELIRNPQAQTSDFWNIFNSEPIHIGCFDDNDLKELLHKLPDMSFDQGAKSELWNESNGYPVLLLGILNILNNTSFNGNVSSKNVCDAAILALAVLRDQLESLWSDCPASSKDLFLRIIEENTISRSGIAQSDIDHLIEKGFITQAGNKIQSPCRLLTNYLKDQPNEGNALMRLFGTPDNYLSNMKSVFERRIDHITGIDPELKRYLERAIGDLPAYPKVFMTNIRGIVDRVFELIWDAELPCRKIRTDWLDYWESNDEKVDVLRTGFPQGGRRVHLLKLMTGTEKCLPKTLKISKTTFYLVNSVQSFGDFGQHQNGAIIDPGTAYAIFLLCLELVVTVTKELN